MKNCTALCLACVATFAVFTQARAGFDEFINFDEPGVKLGAPLPLTIKNVHFSYSTIDARGAAGASVNTGPYPNNPGIEGSTFGYINLDFNNPVRAFGFTFALLSSGFVQDAVMIEYFGAGGASLGMTSIDADGSVLGQKGKGGDFSMGLVNISSMDNIHSVTLKFAEFQTLDNTFDRDFRGDIKPIERFFFDNLGYDFAQLGSIVPLPTPAFMGITGLMGLASLRRRRAL